MTASVLEQPETALDPKQAAAKNTLTPGDHIPSVALNILRASDGKQDAATSAEQGWHATQSDEFFKSRTVVLFALPGAFTPTCSSQHLPRYEALAQTLFAQGVDEIVCLAVNDPWVMSAWAQAQGVRFVTLASDGDATFTRAMGMNVDLSKHGLGERSWRYSMLVRDGVIEQLFAEPHDDSDDPYQVSDADHMLQAINSDAEAPPQVAVLTREGCPHCERMRQMLDEASLDYIELPLDDAIRGATVRAMTGAITVPQVFIDGHLIGGNEQLEKHLYGPGGRPETRTA